MNRTTPPALRGVLVSAEARKTSSEFELDLLTAGLDRSA